ncbi:hypothetical protein L2E82_08680 [Cichorium intybus]|uniref:Uncharacterized protein n=1 Tax=Cichorium intybus TaxID=13427 RepID=A0ACB9G7U5_CICIN|nr:hypothetical protein L2E82_08680 [Cichorium intybus]
MDEDHDELKFACKLCDKRYPSGKSLGGHMRSHVIRAPVATISAESDDKFDPMKKLSTSIINGNGNGNVNGNGNENMNSISYGLRENPKKSWRAVGSSSSSLPFRNEKVCKQCGKRFQSSKALCGHMAFHSDKDRNSKDYDHSWTSENLDSDDDKLISDSLSDTEENELQDPIFVTRSKSKRYKKIVVKQSSFLTDSNNSNYNYGSSSISEVHEHEQEEVAMCLMMLSKDSTNWAGVNSIMESSSNNSVVRWNGIKKVESDITVEELLRNGDQHKKSKGVNGFNYKELTYEEKLEIRRNLFKEFGYNDNLKKIIRDDDDDDSYTLEGSYKKRRKYECMNCNKIFGSFQGLGGHRPCHKKNNSEGKFHNQKAKIDKKMRPKKNKGHECPICFRMFKSGQALGGHKRSHFVNGSEERFDDMAVIEHEGPTYIDMIDLNVPAPEED